MAWNARKWGDHQNGLYLFQLNRLFQSTHPLPTTNLQQLHGRSQGGDWNEPRLSNYKLGLVHEFEHIPSQINWEAKILFLEFTECKKTLLKNPECKAGTHSSASKTYILIIFWIASYYNLPQITPFNTFISCQPLIHWMKSVIFLQHSINHGKSFVVQVTF